MHITGHLIIHMPANHGVDWTAIVSAIAAVVQAAGAIAAIIYSGKLARDAGKRENDANAAAQVRIEAADRAAADRLERESTAHRVEKEEAERERHNAPVRQAIELGDAAYNERINWIRKMSDAANRKERDMKFFEVGRAQALALAKLPSLAERADDASSAMAITALQDSLGAPLVSLCVDAPEWIRILSPISELIETAITALRGQLLS